MNDQRLSWAVLGVVGLLACTDEPKSDPDQDACLVDCVDSGVDATVDSSVDADVVVDSGTDAQPGHDAGDAAVDSGELVDAGDLIDASPDAADANEPLPVVFTPMEWAILQTLSPLPAVPADPTNAYADNAAAAELGQAFFFDKRFSGPITSASGNDLGAMGEEDKIACVSCHGGPYMDDQRTPLPRRVSLGANFHSRNAPTAINSVFYTWTNWGGRFSAPWELPIAVVESPVIMNGTRLEVAHIIYDHYHDAYEAAFGADSLDPVIATLPASGKPRASADGDWELVLSDAERAIVNRVLVNFGKALEAYTRKLISRNAPFDQLIAGDSDVMDDDAKRGAALFVGKARCVNCHSGPMLSDNQFHNLGVPQTGVDHVPAMDNGRFNDIPGLVNSGFTSATAYSDDTTTGRLAGLTIPPPEDTRGAFRTPGLRGVTLTAPYMHSGQFDTLEEVIDFYDVGGVGFGGGASGTRDAQLLPLLLSTDEKADLLAFLQTLNGDSIPASYLVDTSAP